jgi:hypothetical protein
VSKIAPERGMPRQSDRELTDGELDAVVAGTVRGVSGGKNALHAEDTAGNVAACDGSVRFISYSVG